MEGDAKPSQAMEGLLMAPIWLSLSVEGDELTEGSHIPLTDWRIVIAAPLIIENQLQVRGTAMIWERSQASSQLLAFLGIVQGQDLQTSCLLDALTGDM